MFKLFILFLLGCSIHYSDCQCTWPVDFQSGTWKDSDKGDMVFQTSDMTGWAFDVQVQSGATAQTLNQWECVAHNDTYLIMKTTDTFVQFVTNVYTGYRCLRLTKLTDHSYRYYEITPTHANLGGIRLFINENSGLTSINDVCTVQFQASGAEFKVMIKSGSESAAKVYCPYSFLANHTFTYTASSTTNTCDPTTDTGTLDMCSNITELTFNSPSCATSSFYSNAGVVWCVDVVPFGTDIFVALYNGQQNVNTIDNSNYASFICIGVNEAITTMSVTPNSCKSSQTTNAIPVDSLGNSVGSVLAIATDTLCPPCPVLSDPFRGNVSISTAGAVTTATYVCGSNYTLSGDSTRVCQSDGSWSGLAPSCACPVLSNPTNGTVTTSSDGLAVNYSCNVGTVLVGSVTLTCDTSTNTWSSPSPTCDDCQSLSAPENGSFSYSSDGLTSYVMYSCNVGTTLNGIQTRTCLTTSVWDSSAPTCTFCLTLSNPDSGNVTITSNGSSSVATYVCVDGYTLQGSSTSTCGTAGTWDTSAPTCRCDSPPTPTNGTVTVSADFNTATYACDNGTSINGSVTRVCQTDGSGWSVTDPICVLCPTMTAAANGTYSQTSNGTVTTVTFSCDVGTSLVGDSTIYCMSDGSWSSNSPNCSQCDTFTEPSSGNYTLSTNGIITTATVSCDVGTTISGEVTIYCQENGTWSTSNSSISCVTCPSLSSISAGLSILYTNGTSTTAEFTCANGYGMVGDTTSTCLSNGTWTSSTPTCVLTGESTATESDSSSLLPVVIALAVLTAAFAVAFGILLFLYFKSKREKDFQTSAYDQQYDAIKEGLPTIKTSKKIPFPHPPMGHQRHVLMSENTNMTSSRAPSAFTFKDSFGVPGSVTPRSAASSMTLPLHLVRESTSSSIYEQPSAPWTGKGNKSTTPRPSDSISNQRTPRSASESVSNPRTPRNYSNSRASTKPSDSMSNPRTPRRSDVSSGKHGKDLKTSSMLSLEESLDLRKDQNKTVTTVTAEDKTNQITRRKKKKSILLKANSSRGNLDRNANNANDGEETDVPAVDIDDELNSSRRLYSSMYELLEKQESHLNSALNKGSSVRRNTATGNLKQKTDRRGQNRAHSTSPSVRATTPVKHTLQINDPSSCITPRSNLISTVQ